MRYSTMLATVVPLAILAVGAMENSGLRTDLITTVVSQSTKRVTPTYSPKSSAVPSKVQSMQENLLTSISDFIHPTSSYSKAQIQNLISSTAASRSLDNVRFPSNGNAKIAQMSDYSNPSGDTGSTHGTQGGVNVVNDLPASTSSNNADTSSPSGSNAPITGSGSFKDISHFSQPVTISPEDFGLNVAEWDSGMNAPTTVATIKRLGSMLQRYPNNDAWSWKLGRSRNGSDGYKTWNTSSSPFSMMQWAKELRATGNQGIFNINYGMNSQWNGGQSVSDVEQLTKYILNNHIPVKAMVVGSENYIGTTINLRSNKSPQEYANVAKQMAVAIHKIDPSMKVGVNLSPGQDGRLSSNDLKWNQTVLRTDAPYIQFATFHLYPVQKAASSSQLLQQLAQDIPATTKEIHRLLIDNAGKYASKIKVWVTEYNLFFKPRPDTVKQVGGSAALESALLMKSLGVQQIDWWSLHGGAHALLSNGSVANPETHQSGIPYGTFALVGDGQAPEIPMNSFYPSAQALAKLISYSRGNTRLQVEKSGDLMIGKIASGTDTHWVLINMGTATESVQIGTNQVAVPAANYKIVQTPSSASIKTAKQAYAWSSSELLQPDSLAVEASHSAPPAGPHISSTSSSDIRSNQVLTLHGTGFGNSKGSGYISFSNNNVNWGSPQNFYKLHILKWTNSEIQFVTPSESAPYGSVNLKPGSTASATVFTGNQSSSNTVTMHVHSSLAAHLSATTLIPGKEVTVRGTGFGNRQGNGYVQVSDKGVNIGAPTNFYKLQIVHWTDSSVSFIVPPKHLTQGTRAAVRLMTNGEIETVTMHGAVK